MREIHIHNDIRLKFDLSITDYCFLQLIWFRSNNKIYGGWCIEKPANMAKTLGFGRSSAYRSLEKLLDVGLIIQNDSGFYTHSEIYTRELERTKMGQPSQIGNYASQNETDPSQNGKKSSQIGTHKNNIKNNNKNNYKESGLDIYDPPIFDQKFKEALRAWVEYNYQDHKKKLGRAAQEALTMKFSRLGVTEEGAVQAIETAIANGWRKINDDIILNNSNNGTTKATGGLKSRQEQATFDFLSDEYNG